MTDLEFIIENIEKEAKKLLGRETCRRYVMATLFKANNIGLEHFKAAYMFEKRKLTPREIERYREYADENGRLRKEFWSKLEDTSQSW